MAPELLFESPLSYPTYVMAGAVAGVSKDTTERSTESIPMSVHTKMSDVWAFGMTVLVCHLHYLNVEVIIDDVLRNSGPKIIRTSILHQKRALFW